MLELRPNTRAGGFTLIELMITIAIAAVLLALALPSFRETGIRMKLTSNTNDLIGAIALARSEAAKRGVPVAVIAAAGPSSTGWGSSGWSVQVGGSTLRTYGQLDPNYSVTSTASITTCSGTCTDNGEIVFDATGALVGASEVDLNVCRPDANAALENHIVVQQSGVASSYRGAAGSPAPSC